MIDLNADLGEGFGRWRLTDDEQLLSVVTSANVACGFHAGDPVTMRRVCDWAAERGVRIGAQVSYRDLAGLRAARDGRAARRTGGRGGLPDRRPGGLRARGGHARVVRQAARRALQPRRARRGAGGGGGRRRAAGRQALPVLGLPGSRLLAAAPRRRACPAVPEAFADRAYTDGGHARAARPGGRRWCTDPEAVVARSVTLARTGVVASLAGTPLAVRARSLCVHGDTPGAVDLARRVRERAGGVGRPRGGLRMSGRA